MPLPCCKDRPSVAEPCPICFPKRPPPVERQLTDSKWEGAEEYLREHPELAEILVAEVPGHKYWVIRADDASYQRVHEVVDRVSLSHK